jgi:hypothetical protein
MRIRAENKTGLQQISRKVTPPNTASQDHGKVNKQSTSRAYLGLSYLFLFYAFNYWKIFFSTNTGTR